VALNLVTRQIISDYAAGVPSANQVSNEYTGSGKRSRLLFVVPWRNCSLVGTVHTPYAGQPDDYQVAEWEIQSFVDEVNAAYPGAALKWEDVHFVHSGFLPAQADYEGDQVKLVRQGHIHDHGKDEQIDGLITVDGVKYTAARKVAQQVVDLAFSKLGKTSPECLTHVTPLYGGKIEQFEDFLVHETSKRSRSVSTEVVRHLVFSYGSEYSRVLDHIEQDKTAGHKMSDSSEVTGAEVIHGVREEMAQKLSDMIFRRTELGAAGNPGTECLETCAAIMAAELGWDKARVDQELNATSAIFQL
jgi:glycerol-3-phosphate dehydrogenase